MGFSQTARPDLRLIEESKDFPNRASSSPAKQRPETPRISSKAADINADRQTLNGIGASTATMLKGQFRVSPAALVPLLLRLARWPGLSLYI